MTRRLLVSALAAALLLPTAAQAEDLLQTYQLAREGDPQLSIAESSRLFNKEGAVQARGALLPQIGGSADISRARGVSGPQDLGGVPVDVESSSTSRSFGVRVDQVVFNLGRLGALRSQNALSRAADFDLEAAGDALITRTSAAYFNVLVAIETLAAAQAQEEALQKQFDLADKRLEVGLAPITDVHEARAQYDAARANTIVVRNALEDAYQALAEITGRPIRQLRGLPADFQPQLPVTQSSQSWVDNAVANNPALQASQFQLQSAEANITSARGGHFPSLNASASYGDSKTWGTSEIGALERSSDSFSRGPSVGLSLNVPIFSGGIVQSQVRQAIAQRDIAQDQLEQQRRALERSTRNAYQNVVAGVSEVEARRLAVVSARSAYEASQVGLEVGTRTVVDVLINQQLLFNAERDYALARYNYLQSLLALEQAAGSLDVDDVQNVNRLLTVDVLPRDPLAPRAP